MQAQSARNISSTHSKKRCLNFVPVTPRVSLPKPPQTIRIKYVTNFKTTERGSFGADAPKITIGSMPNTYKDPFANLGPADYTMPDPNSRKILYQIPKSYRKDTTENLTKNIEYIMPPPLKTIAVKIPNSERPPLYNLSDAPGPCKYDIPYGLTPTGHKISNVKHRGIFEVNSPENLGPGCYDVQYDRSITGVTAKISVDPKRGDWMIASKNPGPGEYTPVVKVKEPSYLIGKKSRPSRHNTNQNNSTLYAIDAFYINLPKDIDSKEVLMYLTEEPAVRDFIHELAELVFFAKPADPIGYIRNYYSKFRPNRQDISKVKKNLEMF